MIIHFRILLLIAPVVYIGIIVAIAAGLKKPLILIALLIIVPLFKSFSNVVYLASFYHDLVYWKSNNQGNLVSIFKQTGN